MIRINRAAADITAETTHAAEAEAQDQGDYVESCALLHANDRIEARRGNVVQFSGWVTDLMPELDLFWAVSDLGERRIFELSEFRVKRVRDDAGL
ncbi:hypothetical protein J2T10_003982 [Paenarthrobacter nicotinovorans]|uniref:Uncharacterized protein n=1 Tax=Paenarthrobacter nicotinovorans TaxID=29320 RepID=A0ABT9TU42_PAENI|nr:hypothetical protein [Paenarthrobacter nicotinovorans]MDQ0104308.1 hypothetical protein [Paenarthrobacter nicotinovorans]